MLLAPSGAHTRPTQSRLRQALFNSIQSRIQGSNVLDLFAGSGALGFEALSRGAQRVVFVEESRSAWQLIERNAQALDVKRRIDLLRDSLPQAWKKIELMGPFDLVLADPPYAEGWELQLLHLSPWASILSPQGSFLLEWGALKSQVKELPERSQCLVKEREKNYGDSVLTTYRKADLS